MSSAAFLPRISKCLGWLSVVFAFAAIYVPCSNGQVIDPITAAQAPVPGAGHHYIGMGAETVNPADGTISFDLPIQTPSGRGLSFPFGIRYNDSEPFFITNNGASPQFYWQTSTVNGWPLPFDVNGWSYDLPIYDAQALVVSASTATNGCGNPGSPCNGNSTNYCWGTQNYNFRGLDGVSHTLYVSNWWSDPNNPQKDTCAPTTGEPFGDDGLSASLGTTGSSTQPSLAVTDKSGTVYQFAQGPILSTSPSVVSNPTPFGALAQTITDKNGNQIVLQGDGVVSYGNALNPGSYTDTAGRTVLSWSGLGNTAGDQLNISGLGGITVKWATTTVTFPINAQIVVPPLDGARCGFSGPRSLQLKVVSEIDLPNGQKYSFTYGGEWGRLTKIQFPDGGYVRYLWGTNSLSQGVYQVFNPSGALPNSSFYCIAEVDAPAITDRYVSYDGTSEILHQHFSYTTSWDTSNPNSLLWTSKNTTVTSSDASTGKTTVVNYTYGSVDAPLGPNSASWQAGGQIPVEKTVLYQDGGAHTLETVNKSWYDRFTMIGQQTVLDNGQGETTLRCPDSYDRILAVYEYDFQASGAKPSDPSCASLPVGSTLSSGLNTGAIGPMLRQTVTAYHNFGTTHIMEEPDSVTVSDGSRNEVSQTAYSYDGAAVVSSGTKTGLVSPPGTRGNVTSVSRWLNSSNSFLTTTYTYFDTGQVQSMTDPCGNTLCSDISQSDHKTTYSYADHFAGGTGTPPSQTSSYLTQVTYPNTGVAHQESYTWGYSDGLLRSHTDQNTETTNYQYNDPLLRLTLVQGPPDPNSGNQSPTTTYSYNDATRTMTTSQLLNTSGMRKTSVASFDGMGHETRTQLISDPGGVDSIDTTYDGFGRVYTVSNPYRSPADPTYGITTYSYDAMGRKTAQTNPDKSGQIWTYAGSATQFTDEGNGRTHVSRIFQTDALGRVVSVCELSTGAMIGGGAPVACGQQIPASGYLTRYAYNTLGDLTGVVQGNRIRSFTYDSLSRLITAMNPESGTTCYGTLSGSGCVGGYDGNGNLIAKTDARGFTNTYQYDSLNRMLFESSTAPNSLTHSWHYDQASINGVTIINPIGHLTFTGAYYLGPPVVNLSGTMYWNYDTMGHVLGQKVCTPLGCSSTGDSPGQWYDLSYTYDLAGNMTSYTDGFGTKISENYDNAGRLSSVTSSRIDATHPGTLWSANQANSYGPIGLVTASLGNGGTENFGYDNRQRLTSMSEVGASNQNFHSMALTYYPNSTVNTITDSVANNWTYTYDEFNRLSTALAPSIGYGCGFGYDQYGNRWQQAPLQGTCGQFEVSFSSATNRIDGYCYDGDGNLLDAGGCPANGVHQAIFDGYGNMATDNHNLSDLTSYAFDALGHRIAKWQGQLARMYLYGLDGNPVAEMDGTGNWLQTNVHAGGQFIAEYQGTDTYFQHTDHLGTIRSQSNSAGTRTLTCFSLPFGDSLNCSGNTNPSGYHFTGKERDAESGLDNFGARFYASSMGRFMSPDWSKNPQGVPYADFSNPQSLNLYSYVLNDPLSHTDADGHCDANGQNCSVWDHIAGAVGGALNIVPMTLNIPNQVFNAVSGAFGGPQVPEIPMIQPDAHASAGGVTTGTAAQMLIPIGDLGEGAQLLNAEEGVLTAESERAAQREAMRQEGIPTSQQPKSQEMTKAGRQYTYETPEGTKVVQRNNGTDSSHPGQVHVEAGSPKLSGQTDSIGRPRLQNNKTKVIVKPDEQ